jgi:hypothetical protein
MSITRYMVLRPDEAVALRAFGAADIQALKEKTPEGLTDEDCERGEALEAIARRMVLGDPPTCLRCDNVTTTLGMVVYAFGVLKSGGGSIHVVCAPCLSASADIRKDIIEALGAEELPLPVAGNVERSV